MSRPTEIERSRSASPSRTRSESRSPSQSEHSQGRVNTTSSESRSKSTVKDPSRWDLKSRTAELGDASRLEVAMNKIFDAQKLVRNILIDADAKYQRSQIENIRSDLKNAGLTLEGNRPLGSGTFGDVWRVTDQKQPDVGKVVKIAKMSEDNQRDYVAEGLSGSLLSEIAAQHMIKNENVLNIERVVDMPLAKTIGLIMKEAAHGTLENYIELGNYKMEDSNNEDIEFRILDRKQIARGILNGMAAIHKAGLIHLDFKPANVLMDQGNIPKIADFGSVLSILGKMDRHPMNLTTQAFRAPEQLCGNRKYTFKNDLWSIGICFVALFFQYHAIPEETPELGLALAISKLCGWPASFVIQMDPILPDHKTNFVTTLAHHCFSEIPITEQRSGDQMAKHLLGDHYDYWVVYYGSTTFNRIWILIGNLLQVDPQMRSTTGDEFLGGAVETDDEHVKSAIRALVEESKTLDGLPRVFTKPEFDILPAHTLREANRIQIEYKKKVKDNSQWDDKTIQYAAADIAAKINVDFPPDKEYGDKSFITYLITNNKLTREEANAIFECEEDMENVVDWELFTIAPK